MVRTLSLNKVSPAVGEVASLAQPLPLAHVHIQDLLKVVQIQGEGIIAFMTKDNRDRVNEALGRKGRFDAKKVSYY